MSDDLDNNHAYTTGRIGSIIGVSAAISLRDLVRAVTMLVEERDQLRLDVRRLKRELEEAREDAAKELK